MSDFPLWAWAITLLILYAFYLDISGDGKDPNKTEENIIEGTVEDYEEDAEDAMAIAEDLATGLDDQAGDLADGLNELVGGTNPVIPTQSPPVKPVHPTTGEVLENDVDDAVNIDPSDDNTMNVVTSNAGPSFAPTGEIPDTISQSVEDDIRDRHRAQELMAVMQASERDEVAMLSGGYVKVANRPAGLQDFSRELNPYGTDNVELERGLFPYSKPKYAGCFQDNLRRPALPRRLGVKTVAECAAASKGMGYRVFGMQHGNGTTYGRGECRTGNDRSFGQYGPAYDCVLKGDNLHGDWQSNAVYYN